jgi:hypothetical protein
MGTLLNPKQAAQYLSDRGKPTEKSSLDSARTNGNGPPFYKEDGAKQVEYDTDDLDEYLKSKPKRKYNSTSEYPPELRQKRRKNGAGND